MAEYISKEFMLKNLEVDKMNNAEHCLPVTVQIMERFIRYVKEFPAADVQPVVRCKDCKHRKERHYEESGEKPYIKYECKFTKYSMSDDGFCSFGVRRDGEQNG